MSLSPQVTAFHYSIGNYVAVGYSFFHTIATIKLKPLTSESYLLTLVAINMSEISCKKVF